MRKKLTIGIDVGGTNTDGVLYDLNARSISAAIKIPTDHTNYKKSIEAAMAELLKDSSTEEIISLNISTTLSTNALLEGKGSPVALVLIGYDNFPHIKNEILRTISPLAVVSVTGGHNSWGKEREPLDCDAIKRFAQEHAGSYFAVSSLYSPRNPDHEIKAAEIILAAGCSGVTCGHEIAHSKLNSVKRTITAFLNSSLMETATHLIEGVRECAALYKLSCPVMFLRSDSTLVCEGWCARFPMETIFSGPAASMRGGMILGNVKDENAIVVDMGGTSTDIGVVQSGKAVYSREGATIGSYRTMIPSLNIHSIALGGDSVIRIMDNGKLSIGPERVRPYCRTSATGTCGYTPSDALVTLGVADLGDSNQSIKASKTYAEKLCISAEEFASRVRRQAAARLSDELEKYDNGGRRICVGAPIGAFVDKKVSYVPEECGIASAVGVASSSLSLECDVSIMHSFFDESYYAFLPNLRIKGTCFRAVYAQSREALNKYLTDQAAKMGFKDIVIHISEEYEYLGSEKRDSALAAVTLKASVAEHA